jgi:hypothetical protein
MQYQGRTGRGHSEGAPGVASADDYESTLEFLRSSRVQSAPGTANVDSLGRTYESYVREAMNRLRLGRNVSS